MMMMIVVVVIMLVMVMVIFNCVGDGEDCNAGGG